MAASGSAIVIGVGAVGGLGAAVARRFAEGGLRVHVMGRTQARLERVVEEIEAAGGEAVAWLGDAADRPRLDGVVDEADQDGCPLEAVIFNAASGHRQSFLDMTAANLEEALRTSVLGGFHAGQATAARLIARGGGSLIFTGATASLRGRPPFGAFAAGKAGLRALVQAMARELAPSGVHVIHAIIDGVIAGPVRNTGLAPPGGQATRRGEGALLNPDAIADTYWALHRQDRSAWTHEIDLRPFCEPF